MTVKKMLLSAQEQRVAGQALLTSTQTWVVPNGVNSISVAAFDPGSSGFAGNQGFNSPGGPGGQGGAVRYINNVSVTPGQSISVTINSTDSIFGSIISGKTGGSAGLSAEKGEQGGTATTTGNNRGGNGGNSGRATSITKIDQIAPGVTVGTAGALNSTGGAGAKGSFPGGGGGGGGGGMSPGAGGLGGDGAIYIVWSGEERQFPATRTGYEISGEISWQLIPVLDTLVTAPAVPPAVANNGAGVWIIFTGANDAFHYRSTDNGKTFTKVTRSTTRTVTGLVCTVNGVFVASTRNSLVMRSTDGGVTWLEVSTVSAFCIGYNGSRLMICGNTATGTADGIAFSDNDGASWTKATSLYTGATVFLRSVTFAGSRWWAVSDLGASQRSDDNGVNWVNNSSGTGYYFVLGSEPSFIALGPGNESIVRAGLTSNDFSQAASAGTGGNTYISSGPSRLFITGVNKFLQSFDNAESWESQQTLGNNISGANQTLGRVVGDGFGVWLVSGNSGFLMRGELR